MNKHICETSNIVNTPSSLVTSVVTKTLYSQRFHKEEEFIMIPGARSRNCLEYKVIKPRGWHSKDISFRINADTF